jgi:hypothetical protein
MTGLAENVLIAIDTFDKELLVYGKRSKAIPVTGRGGL